MKKKIIILSMILGVIAFILLWTFRYEISLSRRKFSANLVKHYLPDDVEVMDITGKNNLVIPKLPRILCSNNEDWLHTRSYGNTIIAVRDELISFKDDDENYWRRIDISDISTR